MGTFLNKYIQLHPAGKVKMLAAKKAPELVRPAVKETSKANNKMKLPVPKALAAKPTGLKRGGLKPFTQRTSSSAKKVIYVFHCIPYAGVVDTSTWAECLRRC